MSKVTVLWIDSEVGNWKVVHNYLKKRGFEITSVREVRGSAELADLIEDKDVLVFNPELRSRAGVKEFAEDVKKVHPGVVVGITGETSTGNFVDFNISSRPLFLDEMEELSRKIRQVSGNGKNS